MSYLLLIGVIMLIGLAAQHGVKKAVEKNLQNAISSHMSGAEVAQLILQRNGIQDVSVQMSHEGTLSDHYNPMNKTVHLSPEIYEGQSVSSAAIAAHEVGHAMQHANAWAPLAFRSALAPVANISSQAWIFLLIPGFIFQLSGLVLLAIIFYAFAVLFHFVTLPVEFDASRRAKIQLSQLGIISDGPQITGTKQVLNAAAMTYVVAALAALGQLIYFLMLFLNNN